MTEEIDNTNRPPPTPEEVDARVTAEPQRVPTVSAYWKLDPWNQGYVVALEADYEDSVVRHQVNPYPSSSDNGQQWIIGHRSAAMAGHV